MALYAGYGDPTGVAPTSNYPQMVKSYGLEQRVTALETAA
jgi:hypothetical protein